MWARGPSGTNTLHPFQLRHLFRHLPQLKRNPAQSAPLQFLDTYHPLSLSTILTTVTKSCSGIIT